MGLFVVLGIAMYLSSAASVRKSLGPPVAQLIVAHKLAGQSLTMLIIAALKPCAICNSMALGFAMFRLVDIAAARHKVKRRSRVESNLGILMTTLAAGGVAGILSGIVIRMWPACFG
jgi:hypothetical protein